MPPPLVLLCGPAFSGKSTLAAHLSRRWGFRVVSLDEINARRGLHGGQGIPDAEWGRTVGVARDEVRTLLSVPGARVVVDDTLCFRFLRADFARVAAAAGRDSVLLVLGASLEEIRRRIAENARHPVRGSVAPHVLERHLAAFEWPGEDEPHRVFHDPAGLDAWLAEEVVRW
ncbi:MAG TPA: ATP-binding protein [Myxococcaceae bacterium]|nr:ATP-binding protein [Myxococcaceae bacterium]